MMNKKSVDDKKDWLVKSSMKVLGPFVFDEVVSLLKKKSIHFVDEVRRSDHRWMSIREHKDFFSVVHSLRFEQESGDLTMTSATATSSTTASITKTEPISKLFNDDTTPAPVSHRDSDYQDITSARETVTSGFLSEKKSYGLQSDVRLHQQIAVKTKSKFFIVTGLTAVLTVVFLGYSFLQVQKKNQDFEKRIRLALKYKNIQLYDQSLSEYKKAIAYKEADFNTQVQMAPLQIALDGETLKGRRILEKSILTPGRSRTLMADDYAGIGLSYLSENNYQEAEDALNKSLSFEPNHLAANLNLLWIKYSKKSYAEAVKIIDQLLIPPQPILSLAEAMISVEDSVTSRQPEKIQQVLQKLRISMRGSQQLRTEQMLMIISLTQLEGNAESAVPYMKKLVDEPVQAQNYFVEDPLIFKKWVDGPQWDQYCSDILNRQPGLSIAKMAKAYCLLNLHKENDAMKLVDEGMKQNAKDPYNLLVQLAVYAKTNRVQEAQTLIGFSEIQEFKLPKWIQGKLCLEKSDFKCAENSFKAILEKNPSDIYARSGLASVYHYLGQREESMNAIRSGIADEPLFLSILELRDVLESQ